MPKPMPLYEVWVSSTEMEAIHLRRHGARRDPLVRPPGGLPRRSSDDGGAKVKNAIIVPDGSKGGFVLKRTAIAPER